MKEVVSISLGSSKRDHSAEVELLGQKLKISRIGTDGDFDKAIRLLKELDGKVSAIGLGGIDLYLYVGDKRYAIRDAAKMEKAVTKTPVVDGSGLKNTLERETVNTLVREGFSLEGKKVLMVSAVDRFGMAEALNSAGCKMAFGDLVFGLNIPIIIRSFRTFNMVAKTLLPIVVRMPFSMLYPTGETQDKEPSKRNESYYEEADIIAGDYLLIRKFMPSVLKGKWILTNTVVEKDIADLKDRGVEYLITTTPEFNGRSFGTNVMEALFVTLLDKDIKEIGDDDYLDLIDKLGFKPRIERLN